MAKRRPGCPICRKPVAADAAHRPFCSARCKMVDLGRWFQGEYVVAGEDAIALDPEEFEEHLARLEQARAEGREDDGEKPGHDA